VTEASAGEIVRIEGLGHRGDGIGQGPGGRVYVPFTCPGKRRNRTTRRARVVACGAGGQWGANPSICKHFGRCGGCALQMMSLGAGRALKRDFVLAALKQQGIEAHVAETFGVDPSSRRRTVMTALRFGKRIVLGYSERMSNRVIDVEECPILVSRLETRIRRFARLSSRSSRPRSRSGSPPC
jgi:23S rRNA (uracil1939-C5)-methyltransferase